MLSLSLSFSLVLEFGFWVEIGCGKACEYHARRVGPEAELKAVSHAANCVPAGVEGIGIVDMVVEENDNVR